MGCGSSRVAAVKPAQPSGLVGENEKCTLETDTQRDFSREDSALSKRTTDSGLGPEPGEAVAPPPAAGVTKLPPVRGE
ncbi:stathmin domain-containing protein 1 [Arapaima gigas]